MDETELLRRTGDPGPDPGRPGRTRPGPGRHRDVPYAAVRARLRSRRPQSVIGQGPFEAIVGSKLDAGIGREGFVGAAGSHLFDAGPAVEFGVRWIEKHLNRGA